MNRCMVIIVIVSVFLTGCWDRREIEERVSVVGVGIDYSGNEKAPYLVSFQIPIPVKIAGGGGGEGRQNEAIRVVGATGKSVAHAIENIQKRMNQQIFFGHTRLLIFSEVVAMKGLTGELDAFRRNPQIRRLLWPLVVKGEAFKMLHSNPRLEQIPSVYVMSQIESGVKDERIPNITLGHYFVQLSNSALEPIMNYVEVSEEDVKWNGVSLFDGDKMVGKLDAKESWIVMNIRDSFKGGEFTVYPDPTKRKKYMQVSPNKVKTNKKIEIKDGKVKANISVYMQANINEKSFDTDFSKVANVMELERATERELEKQAKTLIDKLQHQYKVDPIRLGTTVKAYHFGEWQQMNWKEDFTRAEIKVKYKVKFRRTGMEMK